jgi:hypothetical protein
LAQKLEHFTGFASMMQRYENFLNCARKRAIIFQNKSTFLENDLKIGEFTHLCIYAV